MIESITIKDDGKSVTLTPAEQAPPWAVESGFTEIVYLTPEAVKRLRDVSTSADSNHDGYSDTILRTIPASDTRVNETAAQVTEKARRWNSPVGSSYVLVNSELAYVRHALREYLRRYEPGEERPHYVALVRRLARNFFGPAEVSGIDRMRARIALAALVFDRPYEGEGEDPRARTLARLRGQA